MSELYGAKGLRRVAGLTACGAAMAVALALASGASTDGAGGGALLVAFAFALGFGALLFHSAGPALARLEYDLWAYGRFAVWGAFGVWAAGLVIAVIFRTASAGSHSLPSSALAISAGLSAIALLAFLGFTLFQLRARRARAKRAMQALAEARRKGGSEAMERLQVFVAQETTEPRGPALLIRGSPFPGLTSRPWHDPSSLPWMPALRAAHSDIRREAEAVMSEQLEAYRYVGVAESRWRAFIFHQYGRRNDANCARCPTTASVLERIPGAGIREAMFSVLRPGGRIPPHRDSGNFFLTAHLGLWVPEPCGLRVGGLTRTWREEDCLVFDTSYEHEAWNEAQSPRVVLLFDFWHPELTGVETDFLTRLLLPGSAPRTLTRGADSP